MPRATPAPYTLSLHDALPICPRPCSTSTRATWRQAEWRAGPPTSRARSEEHTSELQSRGHLVCRLLLEKKKRHTLRLERGLRAAGYDEWSDDSRCAHDAVAGT